MPWRDGNGWHPNRRRHQLHYVMCESDQKEDWGANSMNPIHPSRTQIDRLGTRLRADDYSDDDLRMLDRFRRSYASAYEHTVNAIREKLDLEPTGRPAKSTN